MSHAPDPSPLVAALPTPGTIADPYPLYRELRPLTPAPGYRDYPPGTVPGQDEPVSAWVLMRYADVAAAARDHDAFSSRDPLQEQSSAPTLMLVNHDNPEHGRLRRIVSIAFSRRETNALEPWIREHVDRLLDGLVSPPGAPREVEVVDAIASVLPARVMMRLLGQPDRDAERCRGWATAFMLSADLAPEARQASNESLVAYFSERVAALATDRDAGRPLPPGLIGELLRAESDGERLTVEEVIRFCMTLVVAGAETTTFLLANLMHDLASLPDIRLRLRAEPGRIGDFIDESMRRTGPPQRLFRVATRDVQIGGRTIPAGDWVALFYAAANHDPAEFPDPETFDLDRPNLRRQLSMGLGIHHCLGSAIARLEASVLIRAILDRCSDVRIGRRAPTPQCASLLTKSFTALHLVLEQPSPGARPPRPHPLGDTGKRDA